MTFQTFAWSKSLPGVGFDIIDNMVIGYKVMDIFDKIMRICLNQLYKQTYIYKLDEKETIKEVTQMESKQSKK